MLRPSNFYSQFQQARRPGKVPWLSACFKAIMSPADAKGLSSYPLWSQVDKPGALFVDVGGNHGYGALAIAKATKNLRFVVEDLPSTIERAQKQEVLPDGVLADPEAGHRLELGSYDIFSGPRLSHSFLLTS